MKWVKHIVPHAYVYTLHRVWGFGNFRIHFTITYTCTSTVKVIHVTLISNVVDLCLKHKDLSFFFLQIILKLKPDMQAAEGYY